MLSLKPTYAGLNGLFTGHKTPRHMPLPPEQIPEPYRRLLVNTEHMTITMQSFHGEPVTVKPVEVATGDPIYGRRITLATTRGTVLYGIVKIDLSVLPKKAAEAIVEAKEPLGRILLDNKVETRVEPTGYLMLAATDEMARLFDCSPGHTLYGRFGVIYAGVRPAVEVLEILSPVTVPLDSDSELGKPKKKVREMIFGNN